MTHRDPDESLASYQHAIQVPFGVPGPSRGETLADLAGEMQRDRDIWTAPHAVPRSKGERGFTANATLFKTQFLFFYWVGCSLTMVTTRCPQQIAKAAIPSIANIGSATSSSTELPI